MNPLAPVRRTLFIKKNLENHYPDPNGPEEDNHHVITGSKTDGTLYSSTATCDDWTSTTAGGRPQCGFSWPRGGGGGGMGGSSHWISGLSAGGCKAGAELIQNGGGMGGAIIGSGGGYGGFYCFALNP